MDSQEYENLAATTTSRAQHGNIAMHMTTQQAQLLHGVVGLFTEGGELTDLVKRHVYYKQELDVEGFKEELGDLCWYMALLLDAVDLSFSQVMQANIDKLKRRYPNGFTTQHARERLDKS